MKAFKGGIQKGTVATDAAARQLDDQTRIARDVLAETTDLVLFKQMTKEQKLEIFGTDVVFGFAPDGGAWMKDGKLVACFEAKKQGTTGNAIERWFKNAMTAKFMNEDVRYVTFCSGKGAADGEVLHKLENQASVMMGNNFTFIRSPEGFTYEEVESVMRQVLESC